MRLLTIPEVSDLLQVHPSRAYQLARDRVIPVVYVGRQVRVPREALQAWIEAGGQPLSGGWRRGTGREIPGDDQEAKRSNDTEMVQAVQEQPEGKTP